MGSKVEADIKAFNIDLEKFSSRWHQLKPKDDLALGASKETMTNALASLKEKSTEFSELVATANKLR